MIKQYKNIGIIQQVMQKQQGDKVSGFLITCDKNKEKLAIKDAYNFLNQYIEEVYGDMETELIEKQLQAKGKQHNLKNQMQARAALKNKMRFLSSVDTNVNCLVFIKINDSNTSKKIDPYAIVNLIMRDVHQQGKEVTRFCHKILPVERSFKAEHFKMLDEIDLMFQSRDNSEMKSWALSFKCRNNSKFNYKQILGQTEKIAKKYGHFVDIYYPQWTVCVEIIHHLMCLAIVQNYKQYDQFRLHKKGQKLNSNQQSQSKPERINEKKEEKGKNCDRKDKNTKQAKQNKQQKELDQQIAQQDQKQVKNGEQQQNGKDQKNKLLQQKIKPDEEEDVDFI